MNKDKRKFNNPFKATLNGIMDLYGRKGSTVMLPEHINLRGKTVMIIGASTGLGYATAVRIARAGANLIMVMRSGIPDKGEAIAKLTGNDNISMYYVDLLDFETIKELVDKLTKDKISVDILISNAAMVPLKSRKSVQGLEEMFMVNYLSAFYLINQLIANKIIAQRSDNPAKIIVVSSESHRDPDQFDWDGFGQYVDYGIKETVARYGYFKLLLTTFANELSRRLVERDKTIEVRVLCPGPVNSNIAREAPGWMQPILNVVFSIFFKSPDKASAPVIYFASQSESEYKPIEYLFLLQPKEMDEKSVDPTSGTKLWELSESMLIKLGYPLT